MINVKYNRAITRRGNFDMSGFNVERSRGGGALVTTEVCTIDADIIAHKAASACDGKFYMYEGKEYGLLKDIRKDYPYGINREAVGTVYEPEEWEDVENSLKSLVRTIERDVEAKEYLHCMSRGKTFRHELATIQPYKGNRDKSKRTPHWLGDCKSFIEEKYNGIFGDGVEADDLLHQGDVIASIDKDLLTVPKLHYNTDKRTITEVTILEADRYFYKQVLTGDSVDNILGLFNVGSKSALCKKVDLCTNVADMHTIVYDAYVQRFGSYAVDMMEENCMLLWILQDREPYFKEVLIGEGKR